MADSHGNRLRDVVVVGGSVAGIRTATALRRRGYDGRIRIISAETAPHYYRPALSKTFLSGDQSEQDVLLPTSDDLDLDVWTGATATALDATRKRLTVSYRGEVAELDYDGLVVATGLTPRRLPFPTLDGIHYVRELAQARALRQELAASPRVVVIGGGLIGCEVAATSRKLGLDVTLVEAAESLLRPVIGPLAGELVTQLHRAHGVRVQVGAGVQAVHGHGRVEAVTLASGEEIPADLVVVAVGTRPQTTWLEGSGLHLDDGVRTAPNLRALGADAVVAVGDVARVEDPTGQDSVRIEHWENAVRQADVAAHTLLEGPDSPAYSAHTTFWSTQFDLQLHVTGHPSASDELRVQEGALEDLNGVATYHRGDRVSAILSLNQPARLRAYRHLLDNPEAASSEAAAVSEGVQP